MGKASITLAGLLFLSIRGLAQPIPAPATTSQATNLVVQDSYMSPARVADFWNDVGIPFVLSNGGGTIMSNSIAKNNGVGTNLTIYGTLTSTNLDSKITSATNGVLATASNIFSIKGSAGGVVPAPATTSQATNLVVQDAYMSPARVGDFWYDVAIPYIGTHGGSISLTNLDYGLILSNGTAPNLVLVTNSPALFTNTFGHRIYFLCDGTPAEGIGINGGDIITNLSGWFLYTNNYATIPFDTNHVLKIHWALDSLLVPSGTNGVNGLNGTNGVDGINGTNGLSGVNGTNASDWNFSSNFSITGVTNVDVTNSPALGGVLASSYVQTNTTAFDTNGAAVAVTNGYPWGNLYDTNNAGTAAALAATNALVIPPFSITNGFVTSSITNGLATTNFALVTATNVAAALTNELAIPTTNGFVTSTITNGLATTNYVNTITNGLATTAYVVAVTNAGNIVFTNNTTWFDTNGAGTAAALAATNNLSSMAFAQTNQFIRTNALPGLTNQFVNRNGDTVTNLTLYGDANATNWTATGVNGWLNTNTAGGYTRIQKGNVTSSGTNTSGYFIGNGGGLTNLVNADTNNAALNATNGMAKTTGLSAFQNTNFFDLAGAGTTAAMAATNALASPLSAFYNTNTFDLAGVGSSFCSNYALPNYIYNDFATNTFTIAMTTNWLCPTGVYSAKIECWGGGAGGATATSGQYGGGGGGGGYSRMQVSVTPNTVYTIVVGGGGAVDSDGTNTTFGSTTVVANGGSKGAAGTPTGTGGIGATAGTGDVVRTGGNGGAGGTYFNITQQYNGGGGGGAAGTLNNGGNASGTVGGTAGAGGSAGGGSGGIGAVLIPAFSASSPGHAGYSPAGGGGGGLYWGTTNLAAGAGAAGQVLITWIPYLPTKFVINTDITNIVASSTNGFGSIVPVNFTNAGNQIAGVLLGSASSVYAGNSTAGITGGTNTSAINNVFIGSGAGVTNSGNNNTVAGQAAMANNDSGTRNVAIGSQSMNKNTTGISDAAGGYQSLYNNTSGSYNTVWGTYGLYNNTTGSSNTVLGTLAGLNQTTGSNNVYIANQGVAGENRMIWIGTDPIHTNTHIAGIINGNGGGLTNIPPTALNVGWSGIVTNWQGTVYSNTTYYYNGIVTNVTYP